MTSLLARIILILYPIVEQSSRPRTSLKKPIHSPHILNKSPRRGSSPSRSPTITQEEQLDDFGTEPLIDSDQDDLDQDNLEEEEEEEEPTIQDSGSVHIDNSFPDIDDFFPDNPARGIDSERREDLEEEEEEEEGEPTIQDSFIHIDDPFPDIDDLFPDNSDQVIDYEHSHIAARQHHSSDLSEGHGDFDETTVTHSQGADLIERICARQCNHGKSPTRKYGTLFLTATYS